MSVRRSLAATLAVALGLTGALVAVAAPASATVDSYTVSNGSNDVLVPNSLPWAVAQAEADPDHTDIVINVTSATTVSLLDNLELTTDVTITGPGPSMFTVEGSTSTTDAVFYATGPGPVVISGITIAPSGAPNTYGIESDADDLTLSSLALDGFGDDNIQINNGILHANDITTVNSAADGFSYYAGGSATISNIRSSGNGNYGFVLGTAAGLDASDLTAADNASGLFIIAFGGVSNLSRVTSSDNGAEGVKLYALGATINATDVTSTGNGLDPCLCGGPGIVVDAQNDATISIARATLTDNTAIGGAGVYLSSITGGSDVTISSSTITGNHASLKYYSLGGGVAVESLEDADSSLTISDSTISGNDASAGGGGIGLYDLGAGSPTGPVTITRTTIDGNTSEYGAGLFLEGSSGTNSGDPDLTISDSTVSGNIASEEGGGLYLFHDSADPDATVLITGTTLSGNIAQGAAASGDGGAIYVDSAGSTTALTVRIEYSTIAANDPPGVGGVVVDGDAVDLRLLSSILAGNVNGDLSFSQTIANFASSYSLVQAPAAGIALGPTNITGVDPQLGALADNGGPTRTMLVSPGSPAYNAGDPSFAGAGLLDQRGQARVYQVIDIGATEWHPALAETGSEFEPEPPLVALLLILSGLAMVAFSRLQVARSVV